MECRRTVISGGVLRSPPSASTAPLTIAANAGVMRHRGRRHSRPYDCGDDVADDVVDEYNNNNNSNVTAVTTINTTQLVDELEQLRTDNFQLRLRVYNAERRVDRLSAAAHGRDRKRCSDSTDTDSDDTDASSGHAGSGTDHDKAAAAKAKATAEAAVRTIHDLLTVNRRLLALLAATVSAKAVSVSTDDKRRWRRLRNHIEEYAADDPNEEKANDEDNDDEFHDASATDSETSCKARVVSAERSSTRENVLRSPPPPPPPSAPLETTGVDDEGAGSEVSRLRGRCRRLERSLQQLVNTELWARNRQIGKLEQQRYVTQVADAAAQRDRRLAEQTVQAAPPQQHHLQQFSSKAAGSTVSPPATKGILVIRSAAEKPCTTTASAAACTELLTVAAASPPTVATITTPPPVLPDYSEVNFFFSCDEDDDDDDDHREDSVGTNFTSSSEEETANSNDCRGDEEEPVRLTAAGSAQVASSTSTRKRHCRPHHRQPQQPIKGIGDSATVTTTTSSSTESAAAEDEARDDLNGIGVLMNTTTATSPCTSLRHRTVSGGSGLHRRRRCRPPRRCSTCGRCSGGMDAVAALADHPRPPSVADVQVQCGDGNVTVNHSYSSGDRPDGELQLQQLRRELDARRRENGRLYDMLLRLQRGTRLDDRGKGDGGPWIPSSDSDPNSSPEPYHRAVGVVRDRIADLLPPLLSAQPISDDDDGGAGDGGRQRYRPDGAEQQQQQQQQQQQLLLLTRLRERIVAYERRELDGGDDRASAVAAKQSAQPRPAYPSDDAVRRMDRTDLVNVALPRVVERLRQALVPLLQRLPENAVTAASAHGGRSVIAGGGDFVRAQSPPPNEER